MSKISFEDKFKEAKEILEKLMDSKITLQESVELYKKGVDNIKKAQEMLEEAKLKIVEINKEESGINK